MKILQLCHKVPFPPYDGGTIAMNNITQGLLTEGHRVKVLAVETPKHRVLSEKMPDNYLKSVDFESVFIDTTLSFWAAFKTIFTRTSYQVSRFYSKSFANKLTEILQKESFDIVQLESIFMAPYLPVIRQFSTAKIVLRNHNIEHLIWHRVINNESNPLKRWAIRYFSRQLKRYECNLGSQIDGFAAISEPDYRFFKECYQNIPGTVIPFGVDLENYPENEDYMPSGTPELFHVGSMNWLPNVEGIEWFLDEVWPKIHKNFPEITFTIAGRQIPEKISQRADNNVIIVGEVASANDFMAERDIMIVPLLSGSGVRVKIIEGMALGKTIITTAIGAEGLAVEHGKNILIANTPDEFMECISKCVASPDICTILGENARNFVALNHNNDLITNRLIEFYRTLLAK